MTGLPTESGMESLTTEYQQFVCDYRGVYLFLLKSFMRLEQDLILKSSLKVSFHFD